MKHEGRSWCTIQIHQLSTVVQDEGSTGSLVSMLVEYIEHVVDSVLHHLQRKEKATGRHFQKWH